MRRWRSAWVLAGATTVAAGMAVAAGTATTDGNRAAKPNGPVTCGGGEWAGTEPPPPSASQAKQQSTSLGLPHNEGWRPGTQGAGAQLPGSAQSARAGSGRGQGWEGPDRTCRVDPTEPGDWPTKGLPGAWQRGPTTRKRNCGGTGTGAQGWAVPVSRYAGLQLAATVQCGPGGDGCRHPNTVVSAQCTGTRVALTGVADLGRRVN